VLIKETPATDYGAKPLDIRARIERPQDPHTVGRQIDPRPDRWPGSTAFDQLWGQPPAMQCSSDRQARDSSSDDEDSLTTGPVSSSCHCLRGHHHRVDTSVNYPSV
jgi:hypothetical protein